MVNRSEIFPKTAASAGGVAQYALPKAAERDKEIELVLNAHRTRVAVVGCGGSGNNTVTRLMNAGVNGIQTLAINTDAQDLLATNADDKILIGRNTTRGLGAGSNPQIGEEATLESQQEIEAALQNSDLVFVTCGLGGGTGTGSLPIVAETAKKLGALTIAAVTLPFRDEGVMRWENACRGLEKLRQHADTVMVIQNDRLLDIVPDMPLEQAFQVADETVVNAVKSITELINQKGLVNLDFADVRSVMQGGGTAIIGLGEGEGEDRAQIAVDMAMQNQLLDVEVSGAKSALIHVTGGPDMSLKDARTVMKIVSANLDASARIIWGSRIDQNLGKAIRVMLIITGLQETHHAHVSRKREQEDKKPAVPSLAVKDDELNSDKEIHGAFNDSQVSQTAKRNTKSSNRSAADRESGSTGRTRRRAQPQTPDTLKFDANTVSTPVASPSAKLSDSALSRAEMNHDLSSAHQILQAITSAEQPPELPDNGQKRHQRRLSTPAQSESRTPKEKSAPQDIKAAASPTKSSFSQVFEEETRAYVHSLHEAAAELLVAPTGQPALRRMKNAIMAINYTAQRFAFSPIVDYATIVVEIFDRAANGEIKITEQFINAVKPVGIIVDSMIQDDADAFVEAKQHREKLLRLMDSFGNQPTLEVTKNGSETKNGDNSVHDSTFAAEPNAASTPKKSKPPTTQHFKPIFEAMDYLKK